MIYQIDDWNALDRVSGWNADINPVIVETAGFVPLEVRFKRFEENGIRAQLNASEFTSSDLRDIFLHPDFAINQYDELEDIEAKEAARAAYIENLLNQKSAQSGSVSVDKPVENTVVKQEPPASESNKDSES